MVTTEERMKILRMLQEGRISPDAAAELLQAIDLESDEPVQSPMPEPPPAYTPQPYSGRGEQTAQAEVVEQVREDNGRRPRWLRVRVTDTNTGKPRVNIRLPLGLVSLGLKLGQRYTPEIEGLNMQELIQAAQSNGPGPFVDVYDDDDGEHVEVFLE